MSLNKLFAMAEQLMPCNVYLLTPNNCVSNSKLPSPTCTQYHQPPITVTRV